MVARMKRVSCCCLLLAGKFASRWKTRVVVPSSPVSSSAGILNWLYGTAVTYTLAPLMLTLQVLPTRTFIVKLVVCLLIGPESTSNATICSRAGGERFAIGAVFALLSAGQPLFDTGVAGTTAVGTLVALSLPSLFLAVTTARSVLPPSAPCSLYQPEPALARSA